MWGRGPALYKHNYYIKTYSGSRIQGSKRHRILDPDPQHCHKHNLLINLVDIQKYFDLFRLSL